MNDNAYSGPRIYGRSTTRGAWAPTMRAAAFAAACMLCCAATYMATVNAFDWRGEYERARAVLIDPRSTDKMVSDALYVIGRNEKETSAAVKRIIIGDGVRAQHARNAQRYISDDWR